MPTKKCPLNVRSMADALSSPGTAEVISMLNRVAVQYANSPLGRLNLAIRRDPSGAELMREWERITQEQKTMSPKKRTPDGSVDYAD